MLYLARYVRPDILWAVNAMAREVTRLTVARDKRLRRLVPDLRFHGHYALGCWFGDRVDDIKAVMFCDASFAGDLKYSQSTSGGVYALLGPSTYVPFMWVCKKQGVVSHSSTEAEVTSLEACLRTEGIPALICWELAQEVFGVAGADPTRPSATGDPTPPFAGRKVNAG